MGCHTWFYKKLTLPTVDKEVMLSTIENFFNTERKYGKEQVKLNRYNKRERILWGKYERFFKKALRNLNNFDDTELMSEYLIATNVKHNEVNGIFYEDVDYHDLFRHSDYNAPILYSFEETMSFIEENNCTGISYFNEDGVFITEKPDIEKIKSFWDENPDGIIEFG